MAYVTYEEFKKMDMRVGTIRAVEPVEGADKLLKCQIEFGMKLAPIAPTESTESSEAIALAVPEKSEHEPVASEAPMVPDIRQIVSGIREFFPEYEQLVGKQVLYIVNLEPRTIRGVESHGMLMAVDGLDGKPVFLMPEFPVAPGAQVR